MAAPEISFVDQRFNQVWENRHVASATLRYSQGSIGDYLPDHDQVKAALAFAHELVEKLIEVDFGARPRLKLLAAMQNFAITDVVAHSQYLMDNPKVAMLMHGIDRDWWRKPLLVDLIDAVLFTSRLLGVGCQLRYPLFRKAFGCKRCSIAVTLPSNQTLTGPIIYLYN